ncbi:AmmeMemoRadiSam system protein B [Photobacterium kagoshimensis]|uniref:AmmeMemoRadiSam system protein B n=1 Tax=Photobacterium kagoshimensis TaxID=2910242 RepID=UPI003D14C809
MNIRHPAVAGRFYDKSPTQLKTQLEAWLLPVQSSENPPLVNTLSDKLAPSHIPSAGTIRALIVPHAGYVYSGHVAAQAYQALRDAADTIKHVILIGPSHRYFFQGCALPTAEQFSTPLGNVTLNTQTIATLSEIEDFELSEQAHALEHSLEVQLPFLQTVLNDFSLLPILTSNVSPAKLAKLIDPLWQSDDTLLVVSSDLSHFHPYHKAQRIDRNTCHLIEHFEPALTPEQACGSTGINTLLLLAKQRGYQLTRLALNNSGDTAGDKEKVVGYVSYLISNTE